MPNSVRSPFRSPWLCIGAALFCAAPSLAAAWHGGTAPPPPLPGTGTGTGTGSHPGTGGGHAPGPTTDPAPTPGHTPGPSGTGGGPTTPRAPAGPMTGAGPAGTPSTAAGIPSTTTGSALPASVSTGSVDPYEATWDTWWWFHQDEYLNLRQRSRTDLVSTSGSELDMLFSRSRRPSAQEVQATAVPALSKLLEHEHSTHILSSALVALARIGEPQNGDVKQSLVPLFVHALSDPVQEVGETAALSLGILGSESALLPLEALARDNAQGRELVGGGKVVQRTRSFAAYGLGLLAARTSSNRTRQVIARALTDIAAAHEGVSEDLEVACVVALGMDPLDAGPDALSSAAWVTRQTLIEALATELTDGTKRALVRAQIPRTLARLAVDAPEASQQRATQALCGVLHREPRCEAVVRESCALAFGLLGAGADSSADAAIAAELARFIANGSQTERSFALLALGQIGAAADTPERAPRRAECRAQLLAVLLKSPLRQRAWSALALGVLEHGAKSASEPQAPAAERDALRAALSKAPAPEELGAIAIGLGLVADRDAEPALRSAVDATSEDWLRSNLALGLGLIGNPESVPALRKVVTDAKYRPFLLRQGSIALLLCGDGGLAPDLLDAFMKAKSQASQGFLSQALGAIGDARSLEALVGATQNVELGERARGFAAVALGMIADKDDAPWFTPIVDGLNLRACPATLYAGDGSGVLDIL